MKRNKSAAFKRNQVFEAWILIQLGVCCLCVGRVALLPSGSLKIQSPSKLDEGRYTCTARNRLGSTSVSSWLQVTGELIKNLQLPDVFRIVDIVVDYGNIRNC